MPVTVRNSERDLGYLRAVHLNDMLAAGLRPRDRVAYFRVSPFLRHPLERFGIMTACHIDTGAPLDRQVDTFLAARPTFLVGFPSVIYGIVEELERRGIRYRGVRNVLFGGERLTPAARRRVVDHFGARASEVYATVETFTVARSCRQGRLHLRRGDVVVEVERQDGSVSLEQGEGEILVTRLRSEAMPLIRYRVGDRVTIVPPGCACGSPGPVVESIEGRTEDRLVAPDGRAVYGDFVTAAVQGFAEVRQMQLVQHRPGELSVAVVTVPAPRPGLCAEVGASVRAALPGWAVDVAAVDGIAPEANGKVKLVKVADDDAGPPASGAVSSGAASSESGPMPAGVMLSQSGTSRSSSSTGTGPDDDAYPATRPRVLP